MEIVSKPSMFDNMGNWKVLHENKVDFVKPHYAHLLIEFEGHLREKNIFWRTSIYDQGNMYLNLVQGWIEGDCDKRIYPWKEFDGLHFHDIFYH